MTSATATSAFATAPFVIAVDYVEWPEFRDTPDITPVDPRLTFTLECDAQSTVKFRWR